ncbi:hypothetical protein CANMA_000359 [Candida margitis]|uniref:uncharacterized protein n=1 Tax=Candida margitis TaxID=1775924 RepID=UPI002227B2C4|nr:uncharacterized protein CANMA_000359 [Candida margitis]KAI5970573.1 hypothetical protein CANMA_000359 [Candida margitis]
MSDISDSDAEDRALDVSLISKQTLQRKLSHLPNGKRQELEYIWGNLNSSSSLHALAEEEEFVEDSDNDASMEVEHTLSVPEPVPLQEAPLNLENKENEGHLQAYINSKYSAFVSERSLRKRNFASTHPYLADQASYLGLSDAHELNTVYEQNDQNLEAIVKLLNYNYVKLKNRYPKDEKYKSKSFYAIIGQQSKVAQQEEQDKEQENARSSINSDKYDVSDIDMNSPRSSSLEQRLEYSQLSDDSTQDVNNFASTEEFDSSSDQDSSADDEGSKENLYVRVGGRYKKEKSALRGIFPESAKHLPIYKAKTSRATPRVKPPRELRKGFAVKKKGSKNRLFRSNNDLEGTFLNDEVVEYVSPDNYLLNNLKMSDKEDSLLLSRYHEPILSEASELSGSETESDSGSDLFSYDEHRGFDQDLDDNGGEALENDAIDRMLTTISSPMSNGSHSKSKSRSKSSSTTKSARDDVGGKNKRMAQHKFPSGKPRVCSIAQRSGLTSHSGGQHERYQRTTHPNYRSIDSFTTSSDHVFENAAEATNGELVDVLTITRDGKHFPTLQGASLARSRPEHISLTRSDSSGTKKILKKMKKNKSVRNQESIENYFVPFRHGVRSRPDRAPLLASVDIEAETNDQTYSPFRKKPRFFNHHLNGPIPLSHEPVFAPGCLLNDIELKKLGNTGDGKTFHRFQDQITVAFKDRQFTMSLLDIDGSRGSADQLCLLLNSELLHSKVHKKDFYQCVRGLIGWSLILQSPPSESEWSWIETLINTLRDSSIMTPSDKFFCLPYLILLQYIMLIMGRINGGIGRKNNVSSYAASYWSWFFVITENTRFENLEVSGGTATKQAESFYIMCKLLELQGAWWPSICASVSGYERGNYYHVLECVHYLCCSTRKRENWEPLQALFQKFSDSTDREVYYRYIEIVFSMNRMRNWQIDDKLILQMYGNITSRRFANLPKENFLPSIFPQIRSRFDVAGDSFFEKFLQLLFWHISSLTDVSQVKRLVTKLLSFNPVQYSDSKEQKIMFSNKFNLLIMLSSISKTDLRTQVEILLSSISEVTELNFLKQAVRGTCIIFEAALSKGAKLPVEGVEIMTDKLVSIAFTVPGAKQLWCKFSRCLRSLVTESSGEPLGLVQLLPLMKQIKVELPTSINVDVTDLCAYIVEQLTAVKTEVKHASNIRNLNAAKKKSFDMANSYMMRQTSDHPLSKKIDTLISQCITIWVVTSYIVDENWDKLVLQTYPFMGNELSRDRFVFHFYMEVSRFYNLTNCKQPVISNIIRGLISFEMPSRLIEFINRLSVLGWELFSFHRIRNVSDAELISTKFGILSSMLNRSSTCESSVKTNVIVYDILRSMKRESSSYSNETYKDFCSSVIKELNRYEIDAKNQALVSEIYSLLGIGTHTELFSNRQPMEGCRFDDDFDLDEQLDFGCASLSLSSSLDDYFSTLQELLNDTSDFAPKWKTVYEILSNFGSAIFQHRFKFSNPHFLGIFELFLNELDRGDGQVCEADGFRIRTFIKICTILGTVHQVLYEGYRISSDFLIIFKLLEQKLIQVFPFVTTPCYSGQVYDEVDEQSLEHKLATQFQHTFANDATTTDEIYSDYILQF